MRLFIAVELPPEVREAVHAALDPLRDRFPRIRWVPAENLHVTLRFLGELGADRQAEIEGSMLAVARRWEPFELSCSGVGAFPSGRSAKTVWVGLGDPGGLLKRLAADLDDELAAGFGREERAFKPHLTVARSTQRLPLLDGLPPLSLPSEAFTVDRLTLFRSHLGGPAPEYESLATARLGA
ncbi:MAG: RNA 2',3'-cyclic phosphodiesterase [Actinomycetota bacterium]